MDKQEILDYVRASAILSEWHFFTFHFTAVGGAPVPFGHALLDTLAGIDRMMPGYAKRTVDDLAAINGRPNNMDDYEQLLARLAEVLVVHHLVVDVAWPPGRTFTDEPTATGTMMNPEIVIGTPDVRLGVEVKTPSLGEHSAIREANSLQIPARALPMEMVEALASEKHVTLPRDNPVKDFLMSADAKFASFKAVDVNFVGVLVIVWDDFDFEVWAPLLHPRAGLLTDQSFAQGTDGKPLPFSNVDAVVVTGHRRMIALALREDGQVRPFMMGDRGLAWEHPGMWAGVTYADNPRGAGLAPDIVQAFGARRAGPADYTHDWVMWTNAENENSSPTPDPEHS